MKNDMNTSKSLLDKITLKEMVDILVMAENTPNSLLLSRNLGITLALVDEVLVNRSDIMKDWSRTIEAKQKHQIPTDSHEITAINEILFEWKSRANDMGQLITTCDVILKAMSLKALFHVDSLQITMNWIRRFYLFWAGKKHRERVNAGTSLNVVDVLRYIKNRLHKPTARKFFSDIGMPLGDNSDEESTLDIADQKFREESIQKTLERMVTSDTSSDDSDVEVVGTYKTKPVDDAVSTTAPKPDGQKKSMQTERPVVITSDESSDDCDVEIVDQPVEILDLTKDCDSEINVIPEVIVQNEPVQEEVSELKGCADDYISQIKVNYMDIDGVQFIGETMKCLTASADSTREGNIIVLSTEEQHLEKVPANLDAEAEINGVEKPLELFSGHQLEIGSLVDISHIEQDDKDEVEVLEIIEYLSDNESELGEPVGSRRNGGSDQVELLFIESDNESDTDDADSDAITSIRMHVKEDITNPNPRNANTSTEGIVESMENMQETGQISWLLSPNRHDFENTLDTQGAEYSIRTISESVENVAGTKSIVMNAIDDIEDNNSSKSFENRPQKTRTTSRRPKRKGAHVGNPKKKALVYKIYNELNVEKTIRYQNTDQLNAQPLTTRQLRHWQENYDAIHTKLSRLKAFVAGQQNQRASEILEKLDEVLVQAGLSKC